MIVKVQVATSDAGRRRVLVYDEKRTFQYEGDLPEDIALIMGQRPKAFFHAKIDGQRRISLSQDAGWHDW